MTDAASWGIWKTRIEEFVSTHLPEIQATIANGHAERCTLCNAPDLELTPRDLSGFVEVFKEPDADAMVAVRFGIELDAPLGQVVQSKTEYASFYGGNAISPIPTTELSIETYRRFPVPEVYKLLNSAIHQHHVQYEPEITIPLCSTCHRRVHTQAGWNDELQPEIQRTEWEQ